MENFTPTQIENNYGTMLVQLYTCHLCHKKMVAPPMKGYFGIRTFPYYVRIDFDAQRKSAGWEEMTETTVDGNYICKSCKVAGLATFECALCHNRHLTTEIEEAYGDPAEYLCKQCYQMVPAKIWDDKNKELRKRHQYDFS